jgi:hypothetical protein
VSEPDEPLLVVPLGGESGKARLHRLYRFRGDQPVELPSQPGKRHGSRHYSLLGGRTVAKKKAKKKAAPKKKAAKKKKK